MDTYEAKELLADSLRCLARSMEQIRLREIEKIEGDDEVMQDHLAQCTPCMTPYEGMSVKDCLAYLSALYKGFEEASDHEILMDRTFPFVDLEIGHLCDMINGYIGHRFPENLVDCATEVLDLARSILPARDLYMKNETMCKHVVASFMKSVEPVIEKHGYKCWKDGEYSLPLGYLSEWMKRYYWNN